MTNKRILTLITLLLFLFLLVGCDWLTPNRPPEITSVPVETATVGVEYVYDVNATDPDGDTLIYSLISVEPPGMEINPGSGKITWTPPIDATVGDEFDVTVQVEDEDGLIDTQDFTITISERELIGIEVDPEEMTLSLEGTGDFEVTAIYNNDDIEDVTSACVYGISDTNIATVDKDVGTITALGEVGSTIISISYTDDEDITKETTLTVTVGDTITISWSEAAVRYFPDGTVEGSWLDEEAYEAVLIKVDGGYHFADIYEYYNWNMDAITDLEGSVVISETGQLSGDATYTSTVSDLPIKEHFEGDVELIINDSNGTMVGTYTQWGYAYAKSDDEDAMASLIKNYAKDEKEENLVPAPEQGPDWWYIAYTEYIAYKK